MSKLSEIISSNLNVQVDDTSLLEAFVGDTYAGKGEGEALNFFTRNGTTDIEKLSDTIENAFSQVSKILQYSATLKNPLTEVFYKGKNAMGGRIESIVSDVADIKAFRDVYNSNPYQYMQSKSYAQYYTYKLDRTSGASVTATQDNTYFNSPEQVNTFIYSQIEAVYNAHVLEQYYYQKLMFVASVMYGQVKYDVGGNAKDLSKKIGYLLSRMTSASNNFNRNVTYAMDREDAVIVTTAEVASDLAVDFQVSAFNPEIVENLWSGAKRIVIDTFPDVWLYEKDHVVTEADIASGFVGEAAPGAPGIKVGTILPAGTLAYPGAPDAGVENPDKPGERVPTFAGDIIQAYICDKEHIIYADDLEINVQSYPDKMSRRIQLVGHSKMSLAINTNRNGIAVLVAAPTLTEAQKAAIAANDSGVKFGKPRSTAKTATPVVKAAAKAKTTEK